MMDFETHYSETLAELYKRTPSYQVVGHRAYHPGLETMQKWDEICGHPHRLFRSIHIAGTNGKGSVAHMTASYLSWLGYRVGLYTSPHLVDFRERIKIISGTTIEMIDKHCVLSFLEKYNDFIRSENASFFEITTMMAFSYFAERKVDFAVIETGLGGRLDSTNIITPVLSVITSIGLDHTDILGDSIEEIAMEKGGIIKPSVPVVVGSLPQRAISVISDRAQELQSSFVQALSEYNDTPSVPKSLQVYVSPRLGTVTCAELDLKGEYQLRNVVLVDHIIDILESKSLISDKTPSLYPIANAAAMTGLHGRWEILQTNPTIICDIAHNPQALAINMHQLAELSLNFSRLVMIFGMVCDKDISSVAHLLPSNCIYYFTNAHGSRALPAAKLRDICIEARKDTLANKDKSYLSTKAFEQGIITNSVEEAVNLYLEHSDPQDLVYIGGSSYVVAEALTRITCTSNSTSVQ